MNVWNELYEEEAAQKAQNLIAAAFGADKEPAILVQELARTTEWLIPLDSTGEVDGDLTAKRLMHFTATLAMLASLSVEHFAEMIEASKIAVAQDLPTDADVEVDLERLRVTAFDLLDGYAAKLREIAT